MNKPLPLALVALLSLPALAGGKPAGGPVPNQEPRATIQAQPRTPRPDDGQRPTIDVVFVLDTTGSMGGLIQGAKQKIWSIASRIAKGKPSPRLRVGLVAYRDNRDAYVTRKYDLTDNLDQVYTDLQTFQAEGGGDWPEHVGRGLADAVGKMRWSEDQKVMKMIFVVGDAPPQSYQDDYRFEVWAKKAAEKNILVNAVRCGAAVDTEIAWRKIATLAGGTYMSIDQSGGMLAVTTPYDEKLAALNREIAGKSLFAGEASARAESIASGRGVAAMAPAAAADRMAFGAATGGSGMSVQAKPGAVDLVAEPSKVAELKAEELPVELAGLDKAQQLRQVQKLSEEKKALSAQAATVAKERDAWMRKNVATKKDSFDEQVMESVRAKAEAIGVSY